MTEAFPRPAARSRACPRTCGSQVPLHFHAHRFQLPVCLAVALFGLRARPAGLGSVRQDHGVRVRDYETYGRASQGALQPSFSGPRVRPTPLISGSACWRWHAQGTTRAGNAIPIARHSSLSGLATTPSPPPTTVQRSSRQCQATCHGAAAHML